MVNRLENKLIILIRNILSSNKEYESTSKMDCAVPSGNNLIVCDELLNRNYNGDATDNRQRSSMRWDVFNRNNFNNKNDLSYDPSKMNIHEAYYSIDQLYLDGNKDNESSIFYTDNLQFSNEEFFEYYPDFRNESQTLIDLYKNHFYSWDLKMKRVSNISLGLDINYPYQALMEVDDNNAYPVDNKKQDIISRYLNIDLKGIWQEIYNNPKYTGYLLPDDYDIQSSDLNNYSVFISYNSIPLFKVNDDKLAIGQDFDNLVNINEYIINLINFKYVSSNISADNLYNNNQLDDLLENISDDLIYDPNKISFKIIQQENTDIISLNKSNQIIKKKVNTKNEIDDTNYEVYDDYDRQQSLEEYKQHSLSSPFSIYNYNLQYINQKNQENKSIIDKIRPTDMIVLWDGKTNEKLHYAEIPKGIINLNYSMSNIASTDRIMTTKSEKEKIKKDLSSLNTPQEVAYICNGPNIICSVKNSAGFDNNGNIDFVDNKDLVLANAIRNSAVLNDRNSVGYIEDDGREIKLNNNKLYIYSFVLNNQTYYFYNRLSAQWKLVQYIKNNSKLDIDKFQKLLGVK